MIHKFRVIQKQKLFYIQYKSWFWWTTLDYSYEKYSEALVEVKKYFDGHVAARVISTHTLELNHVVKEKYL